MILKFKSAPVIKVENPILIRDVINKQLKLIDNAFDNTVLLQEHYFISQPKIHTPPNSNEVFYQLFVNIYFASRNADLNGETYFETETNYIFAKSNSISIENFLVEILSTSYIQFQNLFHQTINGYKSIGLIKKETQIDFLDAVPKFISGDLITNMCSSWNF